MAATRAQKALFSSQSEPVHSILLEGRHGMAVGIQCDTDQQASVPPSRPGLRQQVEQVVVVSSMRLAPCKAPTTAPTMAATLSLSQVSFTARTIASLGSSACRHRMWSTEGTVSIR
jgi:hypothetical protein